MISRPIPTKLRVIMIKLFFTTFSYTVSASSMKFLFVVSSEHCRLGIWLK